MNWNPPKLVWKFQRSRPANPSVAIDAMNPMARASSGRRAGVSNTKNAPIIGVKMSAVRMG